MPCRKRSNYQVTLASRSSIFEEEEEGEVTGKKWSAVGMLEVDLAVRASEVKYASSPCALALIHSYLPQQHIADN